MADRVRIAHPRTDAARRVPARPPSREIDEQTAIGELYMHSLIRSQLRLALGRLRAWSSLLGGNASSRAFSPRWGDLRIFGISLPWVMSASSSTPSDRPGRAIWSGRPTRNEATFVELLRHR